MNKKIAAIMSVIIIGSGSFYAGMRYSQSKTAASGKGNLANLSPEDRQTRFQQLGAAGGIGGQKGMRNGGGIVSGEIISKDDKSVTVKLHDGGSKIIFLSESTSVAKSVDEFAKDIAVGEQVTASGSPNSDGSITAQSVQIRPSLPNNK